MKSFDELLASRKTGKYLLGDSEGGIAITLQRVTKVEDDKLKAIAKKSERVFNQATKQFDGGEMDLDDYTWLRLAHAIIDPVIPGDDVRAKADWLAENLTGMQGQELLAASLQLDRFDLQRALDQVKN